MWYQYQVLVLVPGEEKEDLNYQVLLPGTSSRVVPGNHIIISWLSVVQKYHTTWYLVSYPLCTWYCYRTRY